MTSNTRKSGLSRRQFNTGVAAAGAIAATGLAPAVIRAQDKTEIRMATYTISEAWDATIQDVVDTFNAQSADVSVKLEFRPGDQYWDKIQTEYAGGQAPDITLQPDRLARCRRLPRDVRRPQAVSTSGTRST